MVIDDVISLTLFIPSPPLFFFGFFYVSAAYTVALSLQPQPLQLGVRFDTHDINNTSE